MDKQSCACEGQEKASEEDIESLQQTTQTIATQSTPDESRNITIKNAHIPQQTTSNERSNLAIKNVHILQQTTSNERSNLAIKNVHIPQQTTSNERSNLAIKNVHIPQQTMSNESSNLAIKNVHIPQQTTSNERSNLAIKNVHIPQQTSNESSNLAIKNAHIPQQTTSDAHNKKHEPKFSSPDVNIADAKQKDIIFEVDKVGHLEFDNCTVRKLDSSNESQQNVNSDIDNHELSSNNSTRDGMFSSDTESAEENRLSLCQIGAEEVEQQITHTEEININEQLTDNNNIKSSTVHADQRSQTNVSFHVEIDEVNNIIQNDEVVDNYISTQTSLLKNVSFLTKENSAHTSTSTGNSVRTYNDVTHSPLGPCSEVEDQHIVENNSSTYSNTADRLSEPSTSSCNEEAFHSASEFQPIILDVRGGCSEMETENMNENQSWAYLGALTNNLSVCTVVKNKSASDGADNMTSYKKSAFQLLQGMIKHAASSKHKDTMSTADIVEMDKPYSAAESPTKLKRSLKGKLSDSIARKRKLISGGTDNVISFKQFASQLGMMTPDISSEPRKTLSKVNIANADKPHSGKQILNSLAESIHSRRKSELEIQTMAAARAPIQAVSDSGLRSSPTATCPVSSESQSNRSSQVFISGGAGTTAYSCVFVQNNKKKKNKLAFLIPQSMSDLSNVTSSASTGLSKIPVNDNLTVIKNTHCAQTSATSSGSEPLENISILESVSKMVTNTVNNFSVQGKDLINSSLLKVTNSKKSECSQYQFCCSICGEDYCDQQGLNFHMRRTAFYLYFHCSHCKRKIVFYNKCTLWVHIRSESGNPLLNYNDILDLKPYEFGTDDNVDIFETTDRDFTSEISTASQCITDLSNGETVSANITPTEEAIGTKSVSDCLSSVPLEPPSSDNQASVLSKCSICLQEFTNLPDHLCPTKANKYSCPSCGMFLPSACARDAHIKIHYGVVKNMSCPECGEKDFQIVNGGQELRSMFDHVDSCKHFNRILCIKCFCNQEFVTDNGFLKHFVDIHCRTLFKCTFCVLAFTQYNHLIGHLDKIHKMVGTDIGAAVLCLFCQQIVKSVEELREHVDQHVENFTKCAAFRWKCFICSKSFVQKADFNKHLELDHPNKSRRCTICFSLFWSRKNLVEHIIQKKCSLLMAKKLNCCADQHPEVPEQVEESVDLNKLFEINQSVPNIIGDLTHVGILPMVNKSQRFVNILRKPASTSNQSIANDEGSKPNLQSSEKLHPAQPLIVQKQVSTAVSSTGHSFKDKVTSQTCKIMIIDKRNSLVPGTSISSSVCVNQCVVCKKCIETTKLTDHLKLHQSQGVMICFLCQRRDFATIDEAIQHSNTCNHNKSGGVENQIASESQSSMANEVASEVNSTDVEPELEQKQTDGKDVESHSVFPCLLCGLAFQSLSAREEHVSRAHDGTRIVYHCGICKKWRKTTIFTKRELAARHITKKHRIVNMDTVNRLIITEEQNVTSGEKLPDSVLAPDETEGTSAPKRLRVAGEGDYMCGKCGFSCSVSEEFSQHITLHNSAHEPQCPECGLCFTIVHALKKHLFAVHKIKAVDDYLKSKDIVEPELEEEEFDILPEIHPFRRPRRESRDLNSDKSNTSVKVSPPNPLECTVCYRVFDIEANLKTHMRNHGMAFIRSKRRKL